MRSLYKNNLTKTQNDKNKIIESIKSRQKTPFPQLPKLDLSNETVILSQKMDALLEEKFTSKNFGKSKAVDEAHSLVFDAMIDDYAENLKKLLVDLKNNKLLENQAVTQEVEFEITYLNRLLENLQLVETEERYYLQNLRKEIHHLSKQKISEIHKD